jgi:hypothetical protein
MLCCQLPHAWTILRFWLAIGGTDWRDLKSVIERNTCLALHLINHLGYHFVWTGARLESDWSRVTSLLCTLDVWRRAP